MSAGFAPRVTRHGLAIIVIDAAGPQCLGAGATPSAEIVMNRKHNTPARTMFVPSVSQSPPRNAFFAARLTGMQPAAAQTQAHARSGAQRDGTHDFRDGSDTQRVLGAEAKRFLRLAGCQNLTVARTRRVG